MPTPIEKREVFDVVDKFAMIDEDCPCEAVAASLGMPLERVRDIAAARAHGGHGAYLVSKGDDCFTVREGATRPPLEHAAESMPVRHAVLEVLGQS